jgi:hypothetical protein
MDAAKISSLVQRPGIDPRINLTQGIVMALGFDAAKGIYADVQFIPSGETETCLVAAAYAGGGFGMWCPLRVDDTVVVALPNGDPNAGPVVIARLWNSGDPPAAEFKAAEQQDGSDVPVDDFVLRVRDGQKLKIVLSGGGETDIAVSGEGSINLTVDSGKVNVGGTTGTQPIPLGQDLVDYLQELVTYLQTELTLPVSGTTAGPGAAPPVPTVPNLLAQKGRVV